MSSHSRQFQTKLQVLQFVNFYSIEHSDLLPFPCAAAEVRFFSRLSVPYRPIWLNPVVSIARSRARRRRCASRN